MTTYSDINDLIMNTPLAKLLMMDSTRVLKALT